MGNKNKLLLYWLELMYAKLDIENKINTMLIKLFNLFNNSKKNIK